MAQKVAAMKPMRLTRVAAVLVIGVSWAEAGLTQTASPPAGGPAAPAPSTQDPVTSSPPAVLQPTPKSDAAGNRPGGKELPSASSGKRRQQPGATGSIEPSRENRIGSNPASETLTSCLGMWEPATHMTRQQWAQACRRVENRLQSLTVK